MPSECAPQKDEIRTSDIDDLQEQSIRRKTKKRERQGRLTSVYKGGKTKRCSCSARRQRCESKQGEVEGDIPYLKTKGCKANFVREGKEGITARIEVVSTA